ncbi:hypothetical protein Golax_012036 [Gossypium laxum]|uniref:Uncharacterized protein n=1 Tax=Gossypium laxum TaxID=34288 RepID=A0A7J8ZNV3_9ROSI|nr:hypothetical protein [Gossypium laxum]
MQVSHSRLTLFRFNTLLHPFMHVCWSFHFTTFPMLFRLYGSTN